MKTLTEFSQVALRRAAEAHKAAVANSLEGEALIEALQTQLAIPADRVPRVLEALEIVGDGIEKISLIRVFQGEAGPQGATSKGEFHYVVNRAAAPKTAGGPARSSRDGDRGGKGKGDKRGGGGPGGGGGGGGGGPGGPRNDKPRGLGSLKAGGTKEGPAGTERVNFAEIPRAGMGWQWTRAPRDPNDTRPDKPRRGPPGRRPGGGGPGGRGPGGPGGPAGAGRPGGGGGGRGPGGPRAAAPSQDGAAASPVAAPAAAEATAANQE